MSPEILALFPYFINFSIVVVLLVMMGRKPLRKYVYQRHERMRDAVEASATAHRRAAERVQAARRAVAAISEEERSLLQREAAGAEQEKKEIIEKAQNEVHRVNRESDRLAGVEQDEATNRVKVQFLELVLRETEEKLKRGLKQDDHSAILKRAQNSIEVGV